MVSAPAAHTARNTARPKQHHPNRWMWARSRTELVPAPDWALARVPRHVPAVLELLSRHEQRWTWVDYPALSRRLAISPRRAARCVAALHRLGLVEHRVRRRPLHVVDPGQAGWLEGYGSQAWVRPLASCVRRADGSYSLHVPEGFLTMAEERNTWGGRRPGAGRPRKSNRSVVTAESGSKSADPGEGSEIKSVDSSLSSSDPLSSPSEKGPGGPWPSRPGCESSESDRSGSQPTTTTKPADPIGFDPSALLSRPPRAGSRQPIPIHLRGPQPRVPDLDQPVIYPDGWRTYVPEHARPEDQVAVVVRGYNLAARRVYGDRAPVLFGRGADVTRSRLYPQLLAAARALLEHSIPPSAWAAWRLQQAKERGEAKPWGVGRVMQPKVIAKLRGLYRRQADGPVQCARWERVHIEQMLRAREARARWEWGEDPPMSSTRWYGDMRRQERSRGFLDPLECWPRPKRGGGGR